MDASIMNQVYEELKKMTIPQIKEALSQSNAKLSNEEYLLFEHQCNFAISKKESGLW